MFQVVVLLLSALLFMESLMSKSFLSFLGFVISFMFLFFIIILRLGFDLFGITLVVIFSGSILVVLYLNYVFLDLVLFRNNNFKTNLLFLIAIMLLSLLAIYSFFSVEFDLVVFWYNYIKVFSFFKTKFTVVVHFLFYKFFFIESSLLNVLILVGLILILLISSSIKVALKQVSVLSSIKKITSTKPVLRKFNKNVK